MSQAVLFGVEQEWTGRVWMNPPYSQGTPWVNRFIDHRRGVALVPCAKAMWFNRLWAEADAMSMPDQRFTFERGPAAGSIMFPVVFAAFGPECVEAISRLGRVR